MIRSTARASRRSAPTTPTRRSIARLNELSLLANLDPLDPPTPSTAGGVPGFFVGGLSTSFSNLFARRFPTALVQLQMELPLRNRTARANLARSEIAATQLERQRQQLEQVIEAEVRDAMQAVRSSEQRFEAATSQRRYALEQYESERRRFESGLSTVFLVLERQTTYVTSQALELRARADLNQAIAQLERAIGGTLEWHRSQSCSPNVRTRRGSRGSDRRSSGVLIEADGPSSGS